MTIRPVNTLVLIKPFEAVTMKGIHVPADKNSLQRAVVMGVGDKVTAKVKTADTVLCRTAYGMKIEGSDFLLIDEESISAVVS